MALRQWTRTFAGGMVARAMSDLNARHPWNHNDYFHSWILTNLPERRRSALDVGCGRGELLAVLSAHFEQVCGADADEAARQHARARCSGLANVSVTEDDWVDLSGDLDLVTMVAVLHHLDVETALRRVVTMLAPGGRFLAVGIAPPRSLRDHVWDVISIVTNPMIGFVKHPWPSRLGVQPPPFPVREPSLSYDDLRRLVDTVMPGARMRHQVGFRHTIAWTKPHRPDGSEGDPAARGRAGLAGGVRRELGRQSARRASSSST